MSALGNIKRQSKGQNIGGNSVFYFVPIHYVQAVPRAVGGRISSNITLLGSYKWFEWHPTQHTVGANHSGKHGNTGTTYKHKISGLLAGDHWNYTAMLESMGNMRFLVIRKDNNGYYKLLGSKDSPLEFSFDFVSPAQSSGRRGFTFTFQTNSRYPEYFYEGNIATSEQTIDTTIANTQPQSFEVFTANTSIITS